MTQDPLQLPIAIHRLVAVETMLHNSMWLKDTVRAMFDAVAASQSIDPAVTLVSAMQRSLGAYSRVVARFPRADVFQVSHRVVQHFGAHSVHARPAIGLIAYVLDDDTPGIDVTITGRGIAYWLPLLLDKTGPTRNKFLANLVVANREDLRQILTPRLLHLAAFQVCGIRELRPFAPFFAKLVTTPRAQPLFPIVYKSINSAGERHIEAVLKSIAVYDPSSFWRTITPTQPVFGVQKLVKVAMFVAFWNNIPPTQQPVCTAFFDPDDGVAMLDVEEVVAYLKEYVAEEPSDASMYFVPVQYVIQTFFGRWAPFIQTIQRDLVRYSSLSRLMGYSKTQLKESLRLACVAHVLATFDPEYTTRALPEGGNLANLGDSFFYIMKPLSSAQASKREAVYVDGFTSIVRMMQPAERMSLKRREEIRSLLIKRDIGAELLELLDG
jgi:hypothetical protein